MKQSTSVISFNALELPVIVIVFCCACSESVTAEPTKFKVVAPVDKEEPSSCTVIAPADPTLSPKRAVPEFHFNT